MSRYIDYTAIDTSKTIFSSQEEQFGDSCFPGTHSAMSTNGHISTDIFYKKEDYGLYLFSTMGDGLYSIYQNNIALPIRVNNALNNFGNIVLPDTDNYKLKSRGVYCVETYSIYGANYEYVQNLLQYYSETNFNIENNCDVWLRISSDIRKMLRATVPNPNMVVRFVTFVPEEQIDDLKYVYVPNLNIGITKGVPTGRTPHPLSKDTKIGDLSTKLKKSPCTTTVSLSVIDNENPHKPYYFQVGNKIFRVLSEINEIESSGAKIVMKKDGDILYAKEHVNIGDINNIGIYTTRDEAIAKGDPKVLLEQQKLAQEKSRTLYEQHKTTTAESKIDIQELIDRNKMDHQLLMEDFDIMKKRLELKMFIAKSVSENVRMEHELMKMYVDKDKIAMDTLNNKYKQVVTIVGLIATLVTSVKKMVS